MRSGSWKSLLALLPLALFAGSAFGTTVSTLPAEYPLTFDWFIQQAQDGSFVGESQGIISTANDPSFFSAFLFNRVVTFTNPSGPGTAKISLLAGEPVLSATAPSLVAPPGQQYANSTLVQVGMQFYSKVVCQPESVNDFCSHSMRMPLSWNGVYGLSGGSYSGGFSEVTVTASGSYELIKSCADGCSSGSYTGTIEVRPGEIVHFNFDASAYSQNGGLGVATTDPYFYLSPADVADGYSLIFSDFVGNVPPGSGSGVPEPPSLMLFGAGVIAIGIAMRRRRSLKTSR